MWRELSIGTSGEEVNAGPKRTAPIGRPPILSTWQLLIDALAPSDVREHRRLNALHRKEVSPRSQCEGSKSFPWMFPNQARPDTEIQLGPRPIRLRQLAALDQTCRREDILIHMNISLTYIDLTIYELAKCSSPFQALPLERRGAGGDEGDRFSSLDTLFSISKIFCDWISCFSVAGFQYFKFF